MVNMKSDPKTAAEEACCADAPAYPYGLTLCLNSESLEKLGITTLPPIGARLRISAVATVTSISQNQEADGDEEKRIELQVTDMDPPRAVNSMYENSGMNP